MNKLCNRNGSRQIAPPGLETFLFYITPGSQTRPGLSSDRCSAASGPSHHQGALNQSVL
jgi:hypothetical protein